VVYGNPGAAALALELCDGAEICGARVAALASHQQSCLFMGRLDKEWSTVDLVPRLRAAGRGSHSSTLQLNLSAFCVTGGAVRGCSGGV